jgi:putative peptide zinc metalloprotease protein
MEAAITIERAVAEIPGAVGAPAPRLADGIELIGQYRGSGYKEPKYIISRADGQVIQLPHLLYELAANLDGRRAPEDLATQLSAEFGRGITAEQVSFLIAEKLRPVGIAAPAPGDSSDSGETRENGSGTPSPPRRPDALLLLKYRVPVVPERAVGIIASIFQPLFWPPVVIAALAAFVALDVWVVLTGGLGRLVPSATALINQPTLTLLVLASVLVAGMFHECGHVAACRYGGARPGTMGVGIYLVWPAMYSTVTDAYRLSRAGRLRTDLGGIYFNVIFIAAMSAAYLQTGAPWLLVAIVLMHAETAWQFLPNIRLDGYYILADLVGVPDLFSLMGPVLRGLLPGRPMHPRVAELKPWTRRVMTLWVVLVIPVLLYFLGSFLFVAPRLLPVVGDAVLGLVDRAAVAARAGRFAAAVLDLVNIFLLVLPWFGISLILISLGRRLGRFALGRVLTARTPAGGTSPAELPAWWEGAARAATSAKWFVAGAVPAAVIAGATWAAMDRRVATAGEAATAAAAFAAERGEASAGWPDAVAIHQIAALQALLPGGAATAVIDATRGAAVGLSLLGCLLLWPAARRIGLGLRTSAAAILLCAALAALLGVSGSVDPGVLAAVWLLLAVGLAGRGRSASAGAVVAAGIGLSSAPLGAVAVLAAAAYTAGVRFLASGRRAHGAWCTAVALAVAAVTVAVLATGTRPWAVVGAGAIPPQPLVGALLGSALVVGLGWNRLPNLRPLAVGAAALLVCAAVPGAHTTTTLALLTPALALLTAALLGDLAAQPVPRWRIRLAGATLTTLVLGAVVLAVLAATAPVPGDRTRLSAWVRTEAGSSAVLVADPLVRAQLEHDGVAPARLVGDPAAAPPDALIVVSARPGSAAPLVPDGAHSLLQVVGPGGSPTTVLRPSGRHPGAQQAGGDPALKQSWTRVSSSLTTPSLRRPGT